MNCRLCGRYILEEKRKAAIGETLCSRCWSRMEIGSGLPGWRMVVVWGGWAVTATVCISVVVLYYSGTREKIWAWTLMAALCLALSSPMAWWVAGKRNWKLLGSSLLIPLGAWFFLWKAVPGVGWSDAHFLYGAGGFVLFAGTVLLALFLNEMARLPRL